MSDSSSEDGRMCEITPNLWLGNVRDALDIEGLKQRNIHSILTAMRGTVKVKEVRLLQYSLRVSIAMTYSK